jgi:GNAT superfamily N-acetyltransferase
VVAIRVADASDVDALARLHLETVLFAYSDWFPADALPPTVDVLLPLWSRDVAESHAVLIAEDAGVVVGSAVARADGDLARLHVRPHWWGKGIGASLHDHAVDALRAAGHARAGLWVIAANTRARSLYERRSWVLDPTRTLDEVGVLEVRYELDLR